MLHGTLGYIVRDNMVLLGEKKKGAPIGEGTLNGAGGKLEESDSGSFERCLVREHEQEFCITPTIFEKTAVVTFHNAGVPDFMVHTYLITDWLGTPKETAEMHCPDWYPLSQLPFERMLEADFHWLDKLLAGDRFNANVYYKERASGFVRIDFLPYRA